jgi:hypothetical protein
MKNLKYTKGAWKTSLNPLTKNKEYVIETVSDGKLIARVQSEEVSNEECEANANLISTATELLEALIELRSWAISKGINIDGKLIINTDNAINKATK